MARASVKGLGGVDAGLWTGTPLGRRLRGGNGDSLKPAERPPLPAAPPPPCTQVGAAQHQEQSKSARCLQGLFLVVNQEFFFIWKKKKKSKGCILTLSLGQL